MINPISTINEEVLKEYLLKEECFESTLSKVSYNSSSEQLENTNRLCSSRWQNKCHTTQELSICNTKNQNAITDI